MTRDQLQDVTITSDDEFEVVLSEAVEKAVAAEVDVRGAWELRAADPTHDWELVISELARDADGD